MHKPRGCGAKKSLTYKYLGYRRTMRRGDLDSEPFPWAEVGTALNRALFHCTAAAAGPETMQLKGLNIKLGLSIRTGRCPSGHF